ncbi:MAG TPA: PDC sensor domain-containing protein [Thermoanaerobaculia bacterium]|nr:PDC sensor domain-containing protein [Thermoanaerobaculia bacterium]
MKRVITITIMILIFCTSLVLGQETKKAAIAPDLDAAIQKAAKAIEKWGKDPALVREVRAQNAQNMTQPDIDRIDKAWMDGGEQQRVSALLGNACAARLKTLVGQNPAFSESFVMDDKGANVCMTERTSDFWQGDEAKWQKSFAAGKGAVFIDSPKYDTSAKAILVQVSVPVMDGDRAIGAITVGVNTSRLGAR